MARARIGDAENGTAGERRSIYYIFVPLWKIRDTHTHTAALALLFLAWPSKASWIREKSTEIPRQREQIKNGKYRGGSDKGAEARGGGRGTKK